MDGDYYKKFNNFLLTSCQHQYHTEKIPTKSLPQDERVAYYASHILERRDSEGNVQRKHDTCKISETAKEWGGAYGFSIASIQMWMNSHFSCGAWVKHCTIIDNASIKTAKAETLTHDRFNTASVQNCNTYIKHLKAKETSMWTMNNMSHNIQSIIQLEASVLDVKSCHWVFGPQCFKTAQWSRLQRYTTSPLWHWEPDTHWQLHIPQLISYPHCCDNLNNHIILLSDGSKKWGNYHNDKNDKNGVESRRPEEKCYTSSIPTFNSI